MLKRIKFLAIVPSIHEDVIVFNAYFFCKSTKQIFFLKVDNKIVDFVIKNNERQKDRSINYNFVKRVEISNISGIILQKERDQKYNTIIKTKPKFMAKKITTSFYHGFITSQLLNIPMKIDKKILKREGIYITKELLEVSLAQV